MTSFVDQYADRVVDLVRQIAEEEKDNLHQAAILLADAIAGGQRLFGFGCTHSSTTLQDILIRAGGLMLINPIFAPGLEALQTHPVMLSSAIERLEGYAKGILDHTPIQAGDVLILVSVSGRNAVSIEMAMEAQARGIKVIAVTSLEYSKSVESRHSSGKKMYEFADVVLDNKVEKGDATLTAEGMPQKFCPVSGITSPAILQMMIAATIEELLARGITPPVFLAANVEGGDEYNAQLLARYRDRIFYL
jgi:uncharacterized phosphosugar-binding protein